MGLAIMQTGGLDRVRSAGAYTQGKSSIVIKQIF
jgi:hypothetical protein